MDEKEISKDPMAHYNATAQYVETARKIPKVRSFFWLLRCADALNKYASIEVGSKGDSRTDLSVLQSLIKSPDGISQQSIAKQTGRTKQLIVMAIDKLEKKGYAQRSFDSSDRRVNIVQITPKGIEHLNEVFPHTVAMCDGALASLSDAEIKRLLPLITKLTKSLWQKTEALSSEK